MCLLITLIAAIIATTVWYAKAPDKTYNLGLLCWIYWGSSLMWFIDACVEYAELQADFFVAEIPDLINDAQLGLSVVVLGLILWVVVLLIKDPKGVLFKKNKK